ncbi:hypothetical protein [Pseudomonas lopnurensis]|uniref:hypothetical protein n=1 Tax=Pseudomonas lopnurensis TaxID=1477517 RepID=UPI0028ADF50A|nr:hypothetical protein [Pseudomonas lopnurensis]
MIVFVGYGARSSHDLYVNDNNRFPYTASGFFKRVIDGEEADFPGQKASIDMQDSAETKPSGTTLSELEALPGKKKALSELAVADRRTP